MKNIGILGSNGFVGSSIYKHLSGNKNYKLFEITRDNYSDYFKDHYFKVKEFDVLINANGNSNKYWANKNLSDDFEKSVVSVYNTLYDFNFKRYIYISSIDAEKHHSYGFHKQLAETILCKYLGNKVSILRCGNVIGYDMKKGIIYDILNNNTIYLDPNSKMRLITDTGIAHVIDIMIHANRYQNLTLASLDFITVKKIGIILNKKISYAQKLHHEDYSDIDVSKNVGLKNVIIYLEDII